MGGTLRSFDFEKFRLDIKAVGGDDIIDIHDLNFYTKAISVERHRNPLVLNPLAWSISMGEVAMSVHIKSK